MSTTARARVILGRFPRYMDADTPGKLFSAVVESLADGLETQTSQLGNIRRAHRLANAIEHIDLYRLAALHGLREQDFIVLALRLAAVRGLVETRAEGDLLTYLALPDDVFPPWPADATDPPLSEPDRIAAAAERLAEALATLASYGSELDLLRARIRHVIALHRNGNGTVGALLGGAAANLDLDVEHIQHMADGYWHVATCRDRFRLIRPEPPATVPGTTSPLPGVDLVALEENPFVDKEIDPVERKHADRFSVLRPGFEPVFATVRVIGVEDHTVRPMVVNMDEGFGLVYHGVVPDGQELRFQTDGQVLLDGVDVDTFSWSFRGAVFATSDGHPMNFVFAEEGEDAESDRVGTFAVTAPTQDAFAPSFVWPRPGGALDATEIAVGETRFAYFVQQGHFGGVEEGADVFALPVPVAGEFDGSVWAPPPGPGPTAGKVGFEWSEREPFAVRVWIPKRFAALDVEGQTEVRERVRVGLDRHRAAGVHVYVDYASDLWTLGSGVLTDLLEEASAEGLIVNGTVLWADGTEQPT
jgi:hypothetical protein